MENPFRPIVEHVKEKAPAYALAAVVAIGSLALMGEGDSAPDSVTKNPDGSRGLVIPQAPVEHEDFGVFEHEGSQSN